MNAVLVNRLVGTIALVGLIVLVLPSILDGEKQTHDKRFIDIPQPPPFGDVQTVERIDEEALRRRIDQPKQPLSDDIAVDAAQSNALTESSILPADDFKPAVSTTAQTMSGAPSQREDVRPSEVRPSEVRPSEATSSELSLENQTVITRDDASPSVGWVVQMGSFQHQKNVNELMDKLKNNGFRTFSREVPTQRGKLTKVFVGPELEREKLEAQLDYLTELTTLTGRISRFEAVARP